MTDWTWPVLSGRQRISVVGGEVQDSAAHGLRGVGPAVDIEGDEGQPAALMFDPDGVAWGYDDDNGHTFTFWANIAGHNVRARYSHLQAAGRLLVGHTGAAQGPHIHLTLWVDGVRVPPETWPEFAAMLTEGAYSNPAISAEMEDEMTDAQKKELNRIASIFENWERVLRERSGVADAVGYGVSDSFSARLADELKGATGSLRELVG